MLKQTLMKNKAADSVCHPVSKDQNYVTPAVDIFESEAAMVLRVDMPGLDEQSLQVKIKQRLLTLEAQIHAAAGAPLSREFTFTGYQRQFLLPDTLDVEAVGADVKNGVLTLRLPKVQSAQPRKIEVTVH